MSPWSAGTSRMEDELVIGGVSASRLAAEVGTPCYVLDEADLRARAEAWRSAFETEFGAIGAGARVFYGGKALLTVTLARWLADAGLSLDASTDGELEVLLRAGVPGERIGLHGNNKSDAEIARAIECGVAHLTIDSLDEVDRIAHAAAAAGVRQRVQVRIIPGVMAGGHAHISTGHADQKFGLSLGDGMAEAAIHAVLLNRNLELTGLHAHIGSQILTTEPFEQAVRTLARVRAHTLVSTGYLVPELDFGGGFGVAYLPGQEGADPVAYARAMAAALADECTQLNIDIPDVSIEPGRSIIGPAVTTLYTVGTVKRVDTGAGTRMYVSVDGGMSDNLRTALYDASYHAELANRVSTDVATARVVGRHCETGDIVVRDVDLPRDTRRGDLLAVPVTGAYGRSMSSNYNMVLRPPVVAVRDGEITTLVRRETWDDLFATDLGGQAARGHDQSGQGGEQ